MCTRSLRSELSGKTRDLPFLGFIGLILQIMEIELIDAVKPGARIGSIAALRILGNTDILRSCIGYLNRCLSGLTERVVALVLDIAAESELTLEVARIVLFLVIVFSTHLLGILGTHLPEGILALLRMTNLRILGNLHFLALNLPGYLSGLVLRGQIPLDLCGIGAFVIPGTILLIGNIFAVLKLHAVLGSGILVKRITEPRHRLSYNLKLRCLMYSTASDGIFQYLFDRSFILGIDFGLSAPSYSRFKHSFL